MSETVLVLEDNLISLGVVEAILGEAGYQVLKSTNESGALRHVKHHPGAIDLLIADATMAGRTERRIVLSLQDIRPDMKVLFMSGYSREELLARRFLQPNDAFLPKPFTVKFLRDVVSQLLAQPHDRSYDEEPAIIAEEPSHKLTLVRR